MRLLFPALLVSFSIGWSAPLHAQQPEWVDQLLAAARLPVEASDARREGVANDELRSVLEAMRAARVPAHEATALIDTARAVRRQHGPVDNFGAFVQSQLAAGKRGRALAAAIRAEHARRGKGDPTRAAAAGQSRGRGDAANDSARGRGRGDSRPPGRPAARDQKPDARGRPRGAPDKPNP